MKCFMIWLATLSALVVLQGVAAVPALTFTGHVGADFLPDSPHPFPVLQLFDDAAPNVSSCLNYSFLSNATAGVPLDECALQQGSGRDLVSAYLAWSWTEDRLYLGIHCGGVCGDANGNGQVGGGEAIALLIDLSPSWNGDFTPTLALGLPTVNRSSDSNFTSAVLAEIEAWNPDEAYLQFGTVLANVTLVSSPRPGAPDLELALDGFGLLSRAWPWRAGADELRIRVQVFSGCQSNRGEGSDLVPSPSIGLRWVEVDCHNETLLNSCSEEVLCLDPAPELQGVELQVQLCLNTSVPLDHPLAERLCLDTACSEMGSCCVEGPQAVRNLCEAWRIVCDPQQPLGPLINTTCTRTPGEGLVAPDEAEEVQPFLVPAPGAPLLFGCGGRVDACGQCEGGNSLLTHCGHCGADGEERCPGAPLSVVPIPLPGAVRLLLGPAGLGAAGGMASLGAGLLAVGVPYYKGGAVLLLQLDDEAAPEPRILNTSLLLGSALLGEAPGTISGFGLSVAAAGDLDGDGVPDLWVGAPLLGTGRALLLLLSPTSGREGGLLQPHTVRVFASTLPEARGFGRALAVLVLDGNAQTLVVPGALLLPDYDTPPSPSTSTLPPSDDPAASSLVPPPNTTVPGLFLVVLGPQQAQLGTTFVPLASALAPALLELGLTLKGVRCLLPLPDLDGDGRPELAVGVRAVTSYGVDQGAAFVLFLALDGTVRSVLTLPPPEEELALAGELQWGASLLLLPDLLGPASPALLVGAPGARGAHGLLLVLALNQSHPTLTTLSEGRGRWLAPLRGLAPGLRWGRALAPAQTLRYALEGGAYQTLPAVWVLGQRAGDWTPLSPSEDEPGLVRVVLHDALTQGRLLGPAPEAAPPPPPPPPTPLALVLPPPSLPPTTTTPGPDTITIVGDGHWVNQTKLLAPSLPPLTVTWGALRPQTLLRPATPSTLDPATPTGPELLLVLDFLGLEELGPGGDVVRGVPLLESTWDRRPVKVGLGEGAAVAYTTLLLVDNATATLEITLQYPPPPLPPTHPLQLVGWRFRSSLNRLRLTTRLDPSSPILRLDVVAPLEPLEPVARMLLVTEHAEVRLNVPCLVRVDQRVQRLEPSSFVRVQVRARQVDFTFPAFATSLGYDPDVSVRAFALASPVVTASTSTDLLVALSIAVPLAALLLLGAVLLVVLLFRRKRRLSRQEQKWKGVVFEEALSDF